MQRNPWLFVLAGLVLAWCTTVGLFLSGVSSYPWGWLVLLALIGWTWYKVRENG